MDKYRVWERAVYKAKEIEATTIYKAVETFAGTPVLCLQSPPYMAGGTNKSNPARFIASDGSAREFTAYQVWEE